MENSTPVSNTKLPVSTALIGLALCLAAALFPLALILAPAYWGAAAYRCKRPWLMGLFWAVYAALSFLFDVPEMPIAPGCAALAALVMMSVYLMQLKRLGNANTVAVASGVSILALYLAVCLPGILSGEGAFAATQAQIDLFTEALRAGLEPQLALLDEATRELMEDTFKVMDQAAELMLVPALCMTGMCLGLANTLFFRLFCRKAQQPLSPMRPFRLWAIPRNFTLGIFILLIGAIVLQFAQAAFSAAVSNTVNILVGVPLMIQGLCLVDFWIVRRGRNINGTRVLAYIMLGLLLMFSQTPLMLLGCLEQLMHMRERATAAQ